MAEVQRIGAEEARSKVKADEALLVCAYEDETKCQKMRLDGSITLSELQRRLPSLGKDAELIFYCG